jgi:hypothetical protein
MEPDSESTKLLDHPKSKFRGRERGPSNKNQMPQSIFPGVFSGEDILHCLL